MRVCVKNVKNKDILRTKKVPQSASHPRHRAVSVPLARYFDLDESLLRSVAPERVFMSRQHLASTGCCGPDSRPAQLLYSHERGAEVRVPREKVNRKVQRESGRVQHVRRYFGQICDPQTNARRVNPLFLV